MKINIKLISVIILIQVITASLVFVLTRAYYSDQAPAVAAGPAPGGMAGSAAIDLRKIPTPDMIKSLQKPPANIQSNDPAEIDRQANQYFQEKDYDNAARLYRRVLELSPDNVGTLNNLGLTLYYLGRSSEALELLRRGSDLEPRFQRIWLTLGFVESGVGNIPEAKQALQNAIELGPDTDPGKSATRMLSKLP